MPGFFLDYGRVGPSSDAGWAESIDVISIDATRRAAPVRRLFLYQPKYTGHSSPSAANICVQPHDRGDGMEAPNGMNLLPFEKPDWIDAR